jgi:hypothetical protein
MFKQLLSLAQRSLLSLLLEYCNQGSYNGISNEHIKSSWENLGDPEGEDDDIKLDHGKICEGGGFM